MADTDSGHSPRLEDVPAQCCTYDSLFARIRSGHLLVTGNSRLARYIKHGYDLWRMEQGDKNWPTAVIRPWGRWLDDLWESAVLQGIDGATRAVPGRRQLLSLWQHALQHAQVQHGLLNPATLAAELSDTRALAIEWQVDLGHPAWFDGESENHGAFYRWNRAFEKHCQEEAWLPPEDRLPLLARAMDGQGLEVDGPVDLLGFDEFTPARAGLLRAMANGGVDLCRLHIEPQPEKAVLVKCADAVDELDRAARWARHWYEQEPSSSIAIVVPDLQTRLAQVERRLRHILDPGSLPGERPGAWNISLGQPLSRQPMIETAFDLLGLLEQQVDIQHVGRVLRSPWLAGSASECQPRALLEKKLRQTYRRQLTPGSVLYRARELLKHDANKEPLPEEQWQPRPWNCPELSRVLDSLGHFGRETGNRRRSPSWWAASVDRLLADVGWPLTDTAARDGEAWQVLQSWREALRELASLDATSPDIDRQRVVGELRKICHEHIFQPQSPPARIQVLGLYEAHSLCFDHLWVLGLSAHNWPAGARPNPFIPYKLQQRAGLPNCSPQRELDVAQSVTRRLLAASPDCVFSYPGQADGEGVFPSPLLAHLEMAGPREMVHWSGDDWCARVARAEGPRTEPPVMPGALTHGLVTGGSSVLKHQALCPFRAFARNRLGAEALETPSHGISPALHGNLVHKVLEEFWREIRNQAELLQMTPETIEQAVMRHVQAITQQEYGLGHQDGLRHVEENRLCRHVVEFLALDSQRSPFEVTGFEQWVTAEIAGQAIQLRIDRLDTLATGETVIIDYKTGDVKPAQWFGERPEDPQLPLYAISAETVPAAVVFGVIREGEHAYKGVVQRGDLLPGLPPRKNSHTATLVEAGEDMPRTISGWRETLQGLMQDFLAGEAPVDPKSGTRTCDNSYCDLQALCRVRELEIAMESGKRGDAP